jgi:glycosyltransferase involved in cell wall biosynthesis
LQSRYLPVFNGENYLAQRIDSIPSQVYDSMELVMCDSVSTDHTGATSRHYANADRRDGPPRLLDFCPYWQIQRNLRQIVCKHVTDRQERHRSTFSFSGT